MWLQFPSITILEIIQVIIMITYNWKYLGVLIDKRPSQIPVSKYYNFELRRARGYNSLKLFKLVLHWIVRIEITD